MFPRGPFQTAIGCAALRELHRVRDGHPLILDDPFAARLLAPAVTPRRIHELPETPHSRRFRAAVVGRQRAAEDVLATGTYRAVVSIGAGACSLPWRTSVRVVEIDLEPIVAWKRRRAAECGLPPVEARACDLAEPGSLAQALAGVEPDPRVLYIVLGVLPYLDRKAVADLLGALLLREGSAAVVSYAAAERLSDGRLVIAGTSMEPPHRVGTAGYYRSAFTPEDIGAIAGSLGLVLHPLPLEPYFEGRADRLRPGGAERVALIRGRS